MWSGADWWGADAGDTVEGYVVGSPQAVSYPPEVLGAADRSAEILGSADRPARQRAEPRAVEHGGRAERRRRRNARRLELADVRFGLMLMVFSHAITVAIWQAHRIATDVAPGQSTSLVVVTGALFGSISALSEVVWKAPRGRLWSALAGLAAALAADAALKRVLGAPDGTVFRDALLPLACFTVGSLLCLGILAVLSATASGSGAARSAR
jgi:hypothetical protein